VYSPARNKNVIWNGFI